MQSNKVPGRYTVVMVDFEDKPGWFLEASGDGTTPLGRRGGKWIRGSGTLLDLIFAEYLIPRADWD